MPETPIESNFRERLLNNLNAEIAGGTVANLADAVGWLRSTYFFIRARRNPPEYGLDYVEVRKDPQLREYLEDIVCDAARKLDANKMIRYDAK